MKIVVLGGLGLQGKAAIADLAGSEGVTEIVCADASLEAFHDLAALGRLERDVRIFLE